MSKKTVLTGGRRIALVLLILVGGIATVSAQRDRDGEDRVCFYRDVQYQGQAWCYRPGDELADLRDRRNEISSIRIFGRARVIVYDEREFAGASDEFDMDVPDLTLRNMERRTSWNDRIDSFSIEPIGRGRAFGRGRAGRERRDARDRICAYEEPGYRGRSQCWDAGEEERNLNRTTDLNDRISSIRVFGRSRADVFRDADFRGQRLRIDRDIPDLNAMNWGDQISSLRVR